MKDEYLITNHLGGYCSSTFHSGNTRKYHGVLIAGLADLSRKVIISNLEEKLIVDNEEFFINTCTFNGNIIYPKGFQNLKTYISTPKPIFEFQIKNIQIKKIIEIDKYANSIYIKYFILSNKEFDIEITPLITNRNIHSNFFDGEVLTSTVIDQNNALIEFNENESLKISSTSAKIIDYKKKYFDFYYTIEKERGYEATENLFSFVKLKFRVKKEKSIINLKFSYKNRYFDKFNVKKYFDKKVQSFHKNFENEYHFLSSKTQDFLVYTKSGISMIAGYHWFDDWGRDTFISFRGALLITGRFDEAKSILLNWSKLIQNGLIPNRPNLSEYNTLDGSLWFINAVYEYWVFSKDNETIENIYPKIFEIINCFLVGTNYSIHTNKAGYLVYDDDKLALTWMDAIVDGIPVVKRNGECVEIQMLWYNALKVYKFFQQSLKLDNLKIELDPLINRLKNNFNKDFWNEETNYLYDYINDREKNPQIRPNPIIGLTLPFQIADISKITLILKKIEEELYTSVGLMTLSRYDSEFVEYYHGNQRSRDLAYHNGTIWVWLLGLYIKAVIIYEQNTKKSYKLLNDFFAEVKNQGLNYLPEIFSFRDKKPSGCLSQLWSYATMLETIYELEKMENENEN